MLDSRNHWMMINTLHWWMFIMLLVCAFFCSFFHFFSPKFQHRLQQCDSLPTIQYVFELYWFGIVLWCWQSYTIVRCCWKKNQVRFWLNVVAEVWVVCKWMDQFHRRLHNWHCSIHCMFFWVLVRVVLTFKMLKESCWKSIERVDSNDNWEINCTFCIVSIHQSAFWTNSINNWTFGGTEALVRCLLSSCCGGVVEAHSFFHRALYSNLLTGPIPQTIGEMTSLTVLYDWGDGVFIVGAHICCCY